MKEKFNIMDVEGMEFPAGRRTRVLIGDNGEVAGQHFVQGYVVIYPNGSIPLNNHEEEEVYTILSGQGEMQIGENKYPAKALDVFYIKPNLAHGIVNTGESDLVLMFVYAPKKIAEHWAEELGESEKD